MKKWIPAALMLLAMPVWAEAVDVEAQREQLLLRPLTRDAADKPLVDAVNTCWALLRKRVGDPGHWRVLSLQILRDEALFAEGRMQMADANGTWQSYPYECRINRDHPALESVSAPYGR